MSFPNRVAKVLKAEGLAGVSFRIMQRLSRIWFRIHQSLGSSVVRSTYGLKLAANYPDATFKFYVTGAYGSYYWDRISTINYPFVFLDIGANQGLYAIGAAKNTNLVLSYAFEPVRDTFNYLEKNIQLNNAASKCIPINKAIADSCGVAKIATKAEHSGVATLAETNSLLHEDPETTEIELIDAIGLEKIVYFEEIPLVIKIDVEGYEPIVIKELFKTKFAHLIKEIYFEVDENWIDVHAIESDLRKVGFVEFTKVGSGHHYDFLAARAK